LVWQHEINLQVILLALLYIVQKLLLKCHPVLCRFIGESSIKLMHVELEQLEESAGRVLELLLIMER
jgi:hypothetical protein